MKDDLSPFLPLSPAILHILVALAGEDRHGYGIMQEVARQSGGQYKLGPGTLYDNLQKLLGPGHCGRSSEAQRERRPTAALLQAKFSWAACARGRDDAVGASHAGDKDPPETEEAVMTRALYVCLLFLHPPVFRRRFADEMLWIFDEAVPEQGAITLLADGIVSLARQWTTNPSLWRLVAMSLGNVLPFLFFGFLPRTQHPHKLDGISVLASPDFFFIAALTPLIAITLTLVLSVSSFRSLQRRRERG